MPEPEYDTDWMRCYCGEQVAVPHQECMALLEPQESERLRQEVELAHLRQEHHVWRRALEQIASMKCPHEKKDCEAYDRGECQAMQARAALESH